MKWDDGSLFEGDWNSDERLQGVMRHTNGYVSITLPLIFTHSCTLDLSRMTEWKESQSWCIRLAISLIQCSLKGFALPLES